ncbi:hypothetical protein E1264_10125 [Actinomadura sp. KC216]|uniref:hypothetical protein n=1 Tax=Actinomadura sp. KC216 TaxID=2530370 RepID=UPI00104ECF07|nr:hypothetical protein [Actinomadura sp. KC216]TDB88846.1 hypothetical protein E1264_10125 [Actinomadura sp. KC216]
MPSSRPTRQGIIRAQCQNIITTAVNGDALGAYEAFAVMQHRRDFPEIGPIMAEAFIEIIQRCCRALGAVTDGDVPDVARFLVDERKSIARAREAVPSMTAQTMVDARRIHRANARITQEMVETYATQGQDEARIRYQQRAAIKNGAQDLLMMLWGTAINAQRQERAAKVGRRAWTELVAAPRQPGRPVPRRPPVLLSLRTWRPGESR